MKRILTGILLVFHGVFLFGQVNENITEFIFQSGSMIGGKKIVIHPDSAFFETIRPSTPIDTNEKRIKIQKSDWDKLINSVAEYKLKDLVDLPSPSDLRAVDAASSSMIIIITDKSRYNCGTFDDYKPNKKLAELIQGIREIERKESSFK